MKTGKIVLLMGVALWCLSTAAQAQISIYLKTDPVIQGEVTDPGWLNTWQIFSFSLGVSNTGTFGGGGGMMVGETELSDLALQKNLDKASVNSLIKLVNGTALTSVTLSWVKRGGGLPANGALIYEVILEDVIFTTVQHSGSGGGDDRPSESVSFNYNKITWKYYPSPGASPAPTPIVGTYTRVP